MICRTSASEGHAVTVLLRIRHLLCRLQEIIPCPVAVINASFLCPVCPDENTICQNRIRDDINIAVYLALCLVK